MSETYAVTVVGSDRPGIMASVTKSLVVIGATLEDTSMTLLGGQAALLLLVTAETDATELAAALRRELGDDLSVSVRHIGPRATEPEPDGLVAVVSVYGADRPGAVHAVTESLATRGVNVTDMETKVIGDPDEPVQTMVLEVVIPSGQHPDEVAAELTAIAEELEIDCTLNLLDADVL